jgi:NodT family efflux transporter outer membrane factor (OMF) lipoprotein
MRLSHPIISLAVSGLLGACTVGPDYAGPPPVLSSSPPGDAGGFVRADEATPTGAPAVAEWWTVLGDPVLDGIEQRALAANPDIAAARARLDAARAALRLERANAAPNLSAMGAAAHIRIPNIGGGEENGGAPPADGQSGDTTSVNFYNLGLNANWEIDLFGGRRRSTEAARAELGGAEAGIADAQVSLTAAVAQAYLEYRDRQQRIALAEAALTQREALAVLQNQRFERGAGTLTEVEQARAQLEQARQQASGLTAEADGFANALAILAGERPGAIDPLLANPAALPLPPSSVAIGDPAALLERRPDVRAAERRLAAQTARIGVAEAARLPRLSFLGILGIGGTSPEDLTHLDDFTAIGAPMLQWNFLDFGRGAANVGQAEARRDEAEASYRGAVLAALREVEDALGNFRSARANTASQARAEASTAKMEELARQRFELGAAPRTHLIDAELAHAAAQDALVRAKSTLTAEFVTLQKALGLGWSELPAN